MSYHSHNIVSTGNAIDHTTPEFTSDRRLIGMTAHVSAAPTTSEYMTLTLLSVFGPEFDTVLYRLDLSAASTTDVLWTDANLPLRTGDALRLAYANSNRNTIGIRLLLD